MSRYLGLDASTQSLTALVIDTDERRIVLDQSVNFGADLPHYESPAGVLPNPDPLVNHSDPRMWAGALDLLLSRCREAGFDWSTVDGISGSGQQHGSVYINTSFADSADFTPDRPLADQIGPMLSRATAPIWMDSSTSAECREIAAAAGGDGQVCAISGSRTIERFTGPQIRRFAKTDPEAYGATARIHLVSSFMASLLCGTDAAVDPGDGAGMNLLDLATGAWSPILLDATAPDLAGKLPRTAPAHTIAGAIAPYFVTRYGFRAGVPVALFSGDNPNSLVGMGAHRPGTVVVSLGTSDTYFAAMEHPVTDPRGYGHVFGNPAGGFMSLICFKNGSLARERVKDRFEMSWDAVADAILVQTAPGNGGNTMLPYFIPEITPRILEPGVRLAGTPRFCDWGEPAAAVRAVVEAQAVTMRLHSDWIGETPSEIRVTGGASRNPGIVQILADVLGAEVTGLSVTNSAALGAAMRAAAASGHDLDQLADTFAAPDPGFRVTPQAACAELYRQATEAYATRLAEAYGLR